MHELPKSSKLAKIQSTSDGFKGSNIIYVAIIEAAWSCVGCNSSKAIYRVTYFSDYVFKDCLLVNCTVPDPGFRAGAQYIYTACRIIEGSVTK